MIVVCNVLFVVCCLLSGAGCCCVLFVTLFVVYAEMVSFVVRFLCLSFALFLFGANRLFWIVCCLSFLVRCSLFVVCCLQFDARCLLCIVCCLFEEEIIHSVSQAFRTIINKSVRHQLFPFRCRGLSVARNCCNTTNLLEDKNV